MRVKYKAQKLLAHEEALVRQLLMNQCSNSVAIHRILNANRLLIMFVK